MSFYKDFNEILDDEQREACIEYFNQWCSENKNASTIERLEMQDYLVFLTLQKPNYAFD